MDVIHPSQCQVALVKEEVVALGEATPALFDPWERVWM